MKGLWMNAGLRNAGPRCKNGRAVKEKTGMDPFDIDSLSEEDLIELNHKIVARLRFLSQMRSHSAMLNFRIGERVKFRTSGRPDVVGTLTRYNKKSVTVITDSGGTLDGRAQLPQQSRIGARGDGTER